MRIDGEPRYFSWPLQLVEFETLPEWDRIRRELARRPAVPSTGDFEAYCTSIMGETLYRLFIYHYTTKQWGVEPRTLSAEMAVHRIHLRTDGDRRLYQDAWEYFRPGGANTVIAAMLQGIAIHLGDEIHLADLCSGRLRIVRCRRHHRAEARVRGGDGRAALARDPCVRPVSRER